MKNLGKHTGKWTEADTCNDDRLTGHFKEAVACKERLARKQKANHRSDLYKRDCCILIVVIFQ